jgi:D-xylonolactonase
MNIEMLASENAIVGEGPLWDPAAKLLYWTDIRSGRLFRFDPVTGTNETIHRGVFVAGLAVNRHGGLVLGTWEGVMLWRSDSDWKWWHHDPERGRQLQFNDCKAGPDGSFYAGSYYDGDARGKLYRFHPSGDVEIIAENLGISNGMGWSPDLKVFYHTDSLARTIYRYDYDGASHTLSNRTEFVKIPTTLGIPDGMTVDAAGHVWSAIWGSGCVIRFDPQGNEERRIEVPATQTSSVMFGGPALTDVYVTSAMAGTGEPASGMEPANYDFTAHRGGELHRVQQAEVPGKPEFEAALPWRKS